MNRCNTFLECRLISSFVVDTTIYFFFDLVHLNPSLAVRYIGFLCYDRLNYFPLVLSSVSSPTKTSSQTFKDNSCNKSVGAPCYQGCQVS